MRIKSDPAWSTDRAGRHLLLVCALFKVVNENTKLKWFILTAVQSVVLLCSVARLCLTVCDPMDCRTPGFSIPHHLLEFAQVHVHWISDAIRLSHPLSPPSPLPSIFPSIGSSPLSWLFTSGGQSIGASASASVLPMNSQRWFPLGLTGLISLLSKGLSRVFSSTTIWKHQFFQCSAFFMVQLSHLYMTTGKTIALTT